MTTRISMALLAAALASTAGVAAAQTRGRPCPGPSTGSGYGPHQRLFDPRTVQAVEGSIVAVEQAASRGWQGVHLRVKTASETIEVHLGPAWFVSDEVPFAPGDKVRIKASRVTLQGKPLLIAMTVTRGDRTLRLRDADGFPYWAGWRHRSMTPRGPRGRPR